jgi:N-dimethylarginine dimethylaminohydrolase
MDRRFDTVLIRPPSMAYKNCVSSNPEKNQIDPRLAAEQLSTYLTILKENGIEILKLPILDRYLDWVFMQDPALVGGYFFVLQSTSFSKVSPMFIMYNLT